MLLLSTLFEPLAQGRAWLRLRRLRLRADNLFFAACAAYKRKDVNEHTRLMREHEAVCSQWESLATEYERRWL